MKKIFLLVLFLSSLALNAYAEDPYASSSTASADSANTGTPATPGSSTASTSSSYGSTTGSAYGTTATTPAAAPSYGSSTYEPPAASAPASGSSYDSTASSTGTVSSYSSTDTSGSGTYATTSSSTYTPPPPPKPKVNMAVKRLERARNFVASGKYGKAREILEKLQGDSRLNSSETEEARELYEKASMNLLFSKEAMPESTFHTVASGDVLYNIAKKYKTTVEYIKKANGLSKDLIHPGMKLKVINGTFAVRIQKSRNTLELLLNDHVLKTYAVNTGGSTGIPAGEYKMTSKQADPVSSRKGPAGTAGDTQNQLGTRWLGLNKEGYGIHGTGSGDHTASGCLQMTNADAEEIFDLLPYGAAVTVTE